MERGFCAEQHMNGFLISLRFIRNDNKHIKNRVGLARLSYSKLYAVIPREYFATEESVRVTHKKND